MPYEYDIYLPLFFNDGKKIPISLIHAAKAQLVTNFGGVTELRFHSIGKWQSGSVVYNDELLVLRVLSSRGRKRPVLAKMKQAFCHSLKQKEILIIEREVSRI